MVAPHDAEALDAWQEERREILLREAHLRATLVTPPGMVNPYSKVNHLYRARNEPVNPIVWAGLATRSGLAAPKKQGARADTPVTRLPSHAEAQRQATTYNSKASFWSDAQRPYHLMPSTAPVPSRGLPARPATPVATIDLVQAGRLVEQHRPATPDVSVHDSVSQKSMSQRSAISAAHTNNTSSHRGSERTSTSTRRRAAAAATQAELEAQAERRAERAEKAAALKESRAQLLEELAVIDAEIARGGSTGTSRTATTNSTRFYRVKDRVLANP